MKGLHIFLILIFLSTQSHSRPATFEDLDEDNSNTDAFKKIIKDAKKTKHINRSQKQVFQELESDLDEAKGLELVKPKKTTNIQIKMKTEMTPKPPKKTPKLVFKEMTPKHKKNKNLVKSTESSLQINKRTTEESIEHTTESIDYIKENVDEVHENLEHETTTIHSTKPDKESDVLTKESLDSIEGIKESADKAEEHSESTQQATEKTISNENENEEIKQNSDETRDHIVERENSAKVEDNSKKISKSHDKIEESSYKTVKSSYENETTLSLKTESHGEIRENVDELNERHNDMTMNENKSSIESPKKMATIIHQNEIEINLKDLKTKAENNFKTTEFSHTTDSSLTTESHEEIHENADTLNEQHNDLTTNDHKLSTDFTTISPQKYITNFMNQNVSNEEESEEIKQNSDDIKDSENHKEKSIAKSEEIKTNLKVTRELVSKHSSNIISESSDNEIRDNADELNEQHNEEKDSLSSTAESHEEIRENADELNEKHNDMTTTDHKLSTDFTKISPQKNISNYMNQNVGNEDESDAIKHSSDDIKDSDSHEEKSDSLEKINKIIAESGEISEKTTKSLTESLDKEIKTNLKETKELVSKLSSSITSELNENEIRDNAEELNEQHNEEKSITESDKNLKESSTKSVLHEKEASLSATTESHKEIHENADALNEQHNDLTTIDHKLSTDFTTISHQKNITNYINQNDGNEEESEEIKYSSDDIKDEERSDNSEKILKTDAKSEDISSTNSALESTERGVKTLINLKTNAESIITFNSESHENEIRENADELNEQNNDEKSSSESIKNLKHSSTLQELKAKISTDSGEKQMTAKRVDYEEESHQIKQSSDEIKDNHEIEEKDKNHKNEEYLKKNGDNSVFTTTSAPEPNDEIKENADELKEHQNDMTSIENKLNIGSDKKVSSETSEISVKKGSHSERKQSISQSEENSEISSSSSRKSELNLGELSKNIEESKGNQMKVKSLETSFKKTSKSDRKESISSSEQNLELSSSSLRKTELNLGELSKNVEESKGNVKGLETSETTVKKSSNLVRKQSISNSEENSEISSSSSRKTEISSRELGKDIEESKGKQLKVKGLGLIEEIDLLLKEEEENAINQNEIQGKNEESEEEELKSIRLEADIIDDI